MKKIIFLLLLLSSGVFAQNIPNKSLNNNLGVIIPATGISYSNCGVEPRAITEAASGTHNSINSLTIKPIQLFNAGATTNKTATLRIEGTNNGVAGVATNDYAIYSTGGNSNFGGNLKIGDTTGTAAALLELAAGTTGLGPLKFNSGSLITSPIVGVTEYLTDDLYFTISTGTLRKKFVFQDGSLTSGKIPISSTNGRLIDGVPGTDYQTPITLTTTGTSGVATFISNTLNIPQYTGGGGGTVTSMPDQSATNGVAYTVANRTSTPALTFTLSNITPTTIVSSSTIQTTQLGIGVTPSAILHLAKNLTQAAWTTSGIKIRSIASAFTDNTSSGTVTNNYNNVIAGDTNKATTTTTYTNNANLYIGLPVASNAGGGTVAFTANYALLLGGNFGFQTGATATFGTIDNNGFNIRSNATSRILITASGNQTFQNTGGGGTGSFITFTQAANTSGSSSGLLFTAGASTGQTTATEVNDVIFNLSPTMTLVDGTVSNMRAFRIQGRTYNKTTISATLTKASTLSVDGPTMGAGVTGTTQAAIECNGNFLLPTVGNKLFIKEGSGGSLGQTTLVAGTKVITVAGTTISTRCIASLVSQGGTVSTTVGYECACTANTVTINAVTNAGGNTLNVLDTSILNYVLAEPAP